MNATGNSVRVPYSVFYELDVNKIKALRIYMPIDQLLAQMRGARGPERPAPQPDGLRGSDRDAAAAH